jgi:hypothetical protein
MSQQERDDGESNRVILDPRNVALLNSISPRLFGNYHVARGLLDHMLDMFSDAGVQPPPPPEHPGVQPPPGHPEPRPEHPVPFGGTLDPVEPE